MKQIVRAALAAVLAAGLRTNLAKSPEFTRLLNRTWTRFTTGR